MRLVIFDVDGTLVDSQNSIVEAQAMAFAAHGMAPASRERALAVVGLSLPEAFRELAGAEGPVAGLCDAYKEAWTVLRTRPDYAERLYPGAAETVAAFASRPDLRLGLATGKSRKGVDRVLAAHGWQGTFATIQTADDHPSKPHPAMLLAALRHTGIAADRAVMVGDTTFDMAMAVSARVLPVGVAWGYHRVEALRASGASTVVAEFAALRRTLDAFASGA